MRLPGTGGAGAALVVLVVVVVPVVVPVLVVVPVFVVDVVSVVLAGVALSLFVHPPKEIKSARVNTRLLTFMAFSCPG